MAKNTTNAAEILKGIEQQEAEARQKLDAELKAKREKALASALDPLREERDDLDERVNAQLRRIGEIDREIARLTGSATKAATKRSGKSTGKRVRRSADVIAAELRQVYDLIKDGGAEGVSRADIIEKYPSSVTGSALVNALKGEGRKIKMVGTKATARYIAA